MKHRDSIHSAFTVTRSVQGSVSNGGNSKVGGEDYKEESPKEDGSSDSKSSIKKKWFNLNLKGMDRKT